MVKEWQAIILSSLASRDQSPDAIEAPLLEDMGSHSGNRFQTGRRPDLQSPYDMVRTMKELTHT